MSASEYLFFARSVLRRAGDVSPLIFSLPFHQGIDTPARRKPHFTPRIELHCTIVYDTERHQRLGTLFPQIITRPDSAAEPKRAWLCIGPTGHVRGGPLDFRPINAARFPPEGNTPESLAAIEDLIVHVAMLEDGSQQTCTPKQFAEKFGWTNDPTNGCALWFVGLLEPQPSRSLPRRRLVVASGY